jgi:RNA polymerase sigma-70 factor, ECF subfamily
VDTALMTRFRDTRDPAAFAALYEHSQSSVLLWLRRLLSRDHCPLDPVDLLQDTFVNVFRYSSRFRCEHDGSFRVWVRTIAANALRRQRAGTPRGNLQALPEGLQEPVDLTADPGSHLLGREESDALRTSWLLFLEHYARAFALLSPRDRLALELVEVEGLSYAEAGARLRVGPSNMKMIMFRARQRIQGRMRAAMGGNAAVAA